MQNMRVESRRTSMRDIYLFDFDLFFYIDDKIEGIFFLFCTLRWMLTHSREFCWCGWCFIRVKEFLMDGKG